MRGAALSAFFFMYTGLVDSVLHIWSHWILVSLLYVDGLIRTSAAHCQMMANGTLKIQNGPTVLAIICAASVSWLFVHFVGGICRRLAAQLPKAAKSWKLEDRLVGSFLGLYSLLSTVLEHCATLTNRIAKWFLLVFRSAWELDHSN